MSLLPGKVVTGGAARVEVLTDDAAALDEQVAVPVKNITGQRLFAGQRVMVMFSPPSGAVVIGVIGGTGWITWTPTYTNLTIGSGGTVSARWRYSDGSVKARFFFTYGTGSAVGTNPRISLPVPAAAGYFNATSVIGICMMVDSTAGSRFPGTMSWGDGDVMLPSPLNTAGTYALFQVVTASVPFTWATDDVLYCEVSYEA